MNKSIRSFKQGAQAGFTLIELIVVIVILGILAATAIPKFVDMSTQARVAKVNAARGTLQTAATLAHAQWLANGSPTTAPVTVTMEGAAVTLTNSYPDATASGIQAAANMTDYSITGASPMVFATDAGRTGCQASYAAAANANSPPVITVTTTGC